MVKRRLPLGVQTFREIREQNCYYVDKTGYLDRLLDEGKHWFLSRPRRFGKSLFLDTVKEFFEGNEELFRGLHIHGAPGLRAAPPGGAVELRRRQLRDAGLPAQERDRPTGRHRAPAVDQRALRHRCGPLSGSAGDPAPDTGQRVAVLVDEYDKPILDALEKPELARANRDELSGVYGVIKDADAHVCFTLLTGVSKFSKVNLFSGLNNLTDLTLDPRYAAICGYTAPG